MKRTITILLVFLVSVIVVMAGKGGSESTKHIMLYEKEMGGYNLDWKPSYQVYWPIVEGGAYGKITYGSEFVFNGFGLEPNTDYTLIRFTYDLDSVPEVWDVVKCLASGTTNNKGKIKLDGNMLYGGEQAWLVLTEDVNCNLSPEDLNRFYAFNPTEYIFGNSIIE